ncbi:MAG: hypothetical protein EA355_11590 [Rhodobacteraceae bacterium]|nr:MAG: hypothetical protein EA355_11590 [Paracoccaceae bacterium]
MGAALRFPALQNQAAPEPQPLSAEDRRIIAFLRDCARAAHLDEPLHAYAAQAPAGEDAAAWGRSLLRAIGAAATRPFTLHRGRAAEVTFDERWLLRVLRSLQTGDEASAAVLIAGRVSRDGRRVLGWLARGLAERLDAAAVDVSGVDAARAGLDFRMVPETRALAPDSLHRRPA